MSFSTIKPFFEARMVAVDPELKEWCDAFNIDNIPATILDKSWHIRFDPFSYSTGAAQVCLPFECPITISVFFKGYRNPREAVDMALIFADAIVKECTKPVQRLNQPSIKNVLPNNVSIRELSDSNDNAAVLEIQFLCNVILCH